MNSDDVLLATDALVSAIKSSLLYQNHQQLCQALKKNKKAMALIEQIKTTQKQYVKSHFQEQEEKDILSSLQKELEEIPLYKAYQTSLDTINEVLEQMKEELNEKIETMFLFEK